MEKRVLDMQLKTYYKITFPDNTCYIGSTIDFRRRCWAHQGHVRLNKHANVRVQAIYDEYGYDDWRYEILFEETGNKEYHKIREHTLIQETPNTLNMDTGRLCLIGNKEYQKGYLKGNREELNKKQRIKGKKYRLENREKILKYNREWYHKNKNKNAVKQ